VFEIFIIYDKFIWFFHYSIVPVRMVTVTYLKETLKPLYLDAQATTPLDPRVSIIVFPFRPTVTTYCTFIGSLIFLLLFSQTYIIRQNTGVSGSDQLGLPVLWIPDPAPFWLLDPGWLKNEDPDPGSGSEVNVLDHISESFKTIFGLKYVNS
jgi:hypothetical protein